MCSLCGMLGGQAHWTDSSRPAAGEQTETHTRWRERQARVRLVNMVLRHYGLTLAEWSGSSYVLSSRTGRTAIVDNISELWGQAEQLSGRRCDPLDERLLASLELVSG
jgi:hypothetical protein